MTKPRSEDTEIGFGGKGFGSPGAGGGKAEGGWERMGLSPDVPWKVRVVEKDTVLGDFHPARA